MTELINILLISYTALIAIMYTCLFIKEDKKNSSSNETDKKNFQFQSI